MKQKRQPSVNIVTKVKANKTAFFVVPASAVAHVVQFTSNASKNGINQKYVRKQWAELFTTTSKSSTVKSARNNILVTSKKTVNNTNFFQYRNLKDNT